MMSDTQAPTAIASDWFKDIFLARQSIYDVNLNVVGYEVLYRNSKVNRAEFLDGGQATSELLLNAAIEIGLERIVGDKLAFVNLPRVFLTGGLSLPLAKNQLVAEILEDVEIDKELIEGVATLASQGYTLALDDVVFHDKLAPLLSLAHIVKVEIQSVRQQDLAEHVRRFRDYPVKLLAEKVETYEEFEHCQQLGFDLFQGFFLSRPQMLKGRQAPASQLAVTRLLVQLNDPKITTCDLESIIRSDAVLTHKLLRYANSSKVGLRSKVDSLRQVILLLGIQGVRSLVMLISLAGAARQQGDVLKTATQRALMCEKIAKLLQQRDSHAYFTAGLISSLDVVFDKPLQEILATLPLSNDLNEAVLNF
jgi:EAL and modified HD-GYP domain-containing signal transduction protein